MIEGLPISSKVNQNEIFGPVVTLASFKNEGDLVKLTNSTAYGLSASIFTQNLNRAHKLASLIDAGTIWINTWLLRHYWLILLLLCETNNNIIVVVVAEPFSYDVQVCTETFHFQENVMKNDDNTYSYLKIRIFVKPFVKTIIPLVNIARKYSIWCTEEVSDFNYDNNCADVFIDTLMFMFYLLGLQVKEFPHFVVE